jgi:hypothetical protein
MPQLSPLPRTCGRDRTVHKRFTSSDRSPERHSMSEVLPSFANFHPLKPKILSCPRKARLWNTMLSTHFPLRCRERSLGAWAAAMLSICEHTSDVSLTTVKLSSEAPRLRTHLALDWVMG